MKRIFNGTMTDVDGPPPALPSTLGVFETLLLRDDAPVFWSEHWARFTAGCAWHGFAPPISSTALRALIETLAAENGVRHGVARYAACIDSGHRVHWSVDVTPPRPHMATPAFRLSLGPPLPAPDKERAHKHLRRSAWNAALAAARGAGFDEVLLPDASGSVVEAGVSNVFVVKGGVAMTPPLSAGPLPGVIRGAVLALHSRGQPVTEARVSVSHLQHADEVWVTNSLVGIRPVDAVGSTTYPHERPLLTEIRRAFAEAYGWQP